MSETKEEAQTSMENNFFVSKIEKNAMIDVPVYESHNRGKNWMAVISLDPAKPGGLARDFLPNGKGDFYYIVSKDIVGKAVEFGADYYSSSGNPSRNRAFGVIHSLTEDEIRIKMFNSAREAIQSESDQELFPMFKTLEEFSKISDRLELLKNDLEVDQIENPKDLIRVICEIEGRLFAMKTILGEN
jgi:hypothetical protein